MTLHEAIEVVLIERHEGLTYDEIANIINEKKLYQKKDGSPVLGNQIKIRVYNYQHLFTVDQGIVLSNSKYKVQKLLFDEIVSDVVVATLKYSMSVKQVAIPLLFFVKRILEANRKDYDIQIPIELMSEFDVSGFFANSSENVDIKKRLISFLDDLSLYNFEIESIKKVAIEKLKELNADLIIDIFITLDKYSFDSKRFSTKEFGILFNNLVSDLTNTSTFSDRNSSPDNINSIITKLYRDYGKVIMDPFAGSAGTLVKSNQNYSLHDYIGFEIITDVWLLGKMNLILNNISSTSFYNANSLRVPGMFKKQADLIITDAPFAGRLKKEEYDFETFVNTNDAVSIYLQYIINTLNEGGKAVVIVPQGFLFSNSTGTKKLKEIMIDSDWLDAVISLPQGVFMPYSGVSSAVICIDLNKENKKSFFFLDATDIELSKINRTQKIIKDEFIDEIIRVFQERSIQKNTESKIRTTLVTGEEIKENGYDFSPKTYIYDEEVEAQIALFGEESRSELITLNEVMEKSKVDSAFTQKPSLKIIKGKDLKDSLIDFRLTADEIEESGQTNLKNLTLVNSKALLILSHFKSLKPTYFIYEEEPVLISNYISAFKINEEKVLPEYLISQFNANYFIRQLEMIRKGSSQTFFSIKDFLKLRIKLPEKKEQQNLIYEKEKQRFLEEKVSEVDQLTQELIKQKAVAISDQITIISSIQHELGNKLPALKNTIDDLKHFFIHQSKENNSLSLDTKIRPVFPGEDLEEVDSIKDIFARVDNILNYTISMVDDAGGIITSDPSKFKPQKTTLVNYLRSEIEKFKIVHGNLSHIKFILPIDEGPTMNIDTKQFSKALDNIIQNAIRHGFTDKNQQYHLVFQIIPDDTYDILIIKNDGKPFPNDFTIEKYKQPYQFSGKNGHSGLGGYIINQVIENHNGKLNFVEEIDNSDTFKVQFEIKFLKTYFL